MSEIGVAIYLRINKSTEGRSSFAHESTQASRKGEESRESKGKNNR
jgi:hypothetical protein